MFKKKPNIKTLSPLRSSDRRKIADSIISNYGIQVPDTGSGDASQAMLKEDDASLNLTAIRHALLPENSLSAKFSTTSGPNLVPVHGIVYVGSYESGTQRVLWVKLNGTIYPSVYSLWNNPAIVPLLHTPTIVVEKIYKGADLMTPGLAFGPPFPEKARKGAIVAIASMECPSVPVAVGTCVIDINNLATARGTKGIAVSIFHWSGDDLWDWSTSGQKGGPAPKQLDGWLLDAVADATEATDNLNLSDGDGSDAQQDTLPTNSTKTYEEDRSEVDESIPTANENSQRADQASQLTTKEIDTIFYQAMLYGLYEQKKRAPLLPNHGLSYPLSQSAVVSSLVLPFLPASHAHDLDQLVLKKTSWKTPKKFLKAFEKDKILLLKEHKNEVSVIDVEFEHTQINAFVPYSLPTKNTSGATAKDAKQSSSTSKENNTKNAIRVLHLYRPRDRIKPLFEKSSTRKSYYTASEIKDAVKAYIESEGLIDASSKRFVQLNPFIANSVLNPGNKPDAEYLAKKSMPREVLSNKVLELCADSHAILKEDEDLDSPNVKVKSGAPPRVGILMETRSGNKTVTIVHGIENFFIAPQPLAEELRKTCAGSTTVEPWKGGKGDAVLVQGPQKDAVLLSLSTRGVSRTWVDIVDKTKKKK